MPSHHRVDLSFLSSSHRDRLLWFHSRTGDVIPYPEPLPGGQFLVSRPKGIFKPKDLEYALSVRVMLSSPYADKAVEKLGDGTWRMDYFQENPDPDLRDSEYTNRALVRSMEDNVPVGVLWQVESTSARYEVLGLAVVTDWEAGFFTLESAWPSA